MESFLYCRSVRGRAPRSVEHCRGVRWRAPRSVEHCRGVRWRAPRSVEHCRSLRGRAPRSVEHCRGSRWRAPRSVEGRFAQNPSKSYSKSFGLRRGLRDFPLDFCQILRPKADRVWSLRSKSCKILFKILCLAPWLERFSFRFLPDFEAVRPTGLVASLKILQNLIQNPLACAVA